MPPTNDDCLPQVQGCAIRVSALDSNGVPSPGANKLYVTDAFTELQLSPIYEDGDEITEKNACGAVAIDYKAAPSFKRADVSLTLITGDPYLHSMLSVGVVLTDSGLHGYAFPPVGSIEGNGVSIEVWAKRIDDGDVHADFPYAWWVLPKVKNLKLGQRTFNNGSILPVFTGEALENENWYDGPLNDWPVASDRVAQWFPTATKPASQCGPQTLAAS